MTDRATAIVDAVRLRIEDELRQRLGALVGEHQQELSRAQDELRRTAVEAQLAEERWTALLADARTDAQRAVESAVAAARTEFHAEREHERQTRGRTTQALQRLIRDLERSTSISGLLDGIAAELRSGDGRLLVVHRKALQPWPHGSDIDPGWKALAQRAVDAVGVQQEAGHLATPIVLDGAAVAVIVSHRGQDVSVSPDVMAAAAAARLSALVAARLISADRWLSASQEARGLPTPASDAASEREDPEADAGSSARRYAQLLISEIKLYNEGAVAEGRQQRDLLRRLEPEITRARQIFDARVPQDVRGRADYFHDELVKILADGDPSLLS